MTPARVHDLKCWRRFFEAAADGRKTFEVRKADLTEKAKDWQPVPFGVG